MAHKTWGRTAQTQDISAIGTKKNDLSTIGADDGISFG